VFGAGAASGNKEIAMNAKDIMTSKVITVTSGTLVSEIARLLFKCRIAARVAAETVPGVHSVVDERLAVRDTIECEATEGPCRLRIEEILYQPERWMRKNLVVRG
jgi:CBS domain-containing protein